MKKLIVLFCLSVFIASCKKEEDTSLSTEVSRPAITIDKQAITIQHNITEQLTASKTSTWSSSDTNVATVSNTGLVKGVRIGDATITATTSDKLSAKCLVHVTPKSHLYIEPFNSFGKSESYIKSKEIRVLLNEGADGLFYSGENTKVKNVMYLFTNDSLTSSFVLLNDAAVSEINDFISERYILLFSDSSSVTYYDIINRIAITVSVKEKMGLNVMYMYYDFSSLRNGNTLELSKIINKNRELFNNQFKRK